MPALINPRPEGFYLEDIPHFIILLANLAILVSVFVAVLVVTLHMGGGGGGVNGEVEDIKGSCNCCTILNPSLIEKVENLLMYARRANGDITPWIYTVIGALLAIAPFTDLRQSADEVMILPTHITIIIYYFAIVALDLHEFSFFPGGVPEYSFFMWMFILAIIHLGIHFILWLFVKILGSLNQWRINIFVQ